MMYGLKWNVLSHSSPASVPCSAFPFFLFFFFRWDSTISSSRKKNKTARTVITFQQERIVSKYSWTSTTATLGTEESGHSRQVETRVHVWTVRQEKMAIAEKWPLVAVSGGSTVFRNSSGCLIQINRTLHNLNLTSTNREKPNEFSSLQSKAVTTKWTLKD